MEIINYDPWREFRTLREDINRLYSGRAPLNQGDDASTVATSVWSPAVDLKEDADRFVLKADLPGVDPSEYAEVLGGLHHLAISIEVEHWKQAKGRLDHHGVPYDHVDETSLYFRGPDGERLELIADPLRWMYGKRVD